MILKKEQLTQEFLKEILHYDSDSGLFTWRKDLPNRKIAGTIAKIYRADGYLQLSILGTSYLLHRLAWFYITGKWPASDLDHRNGDKHDTRFSNLREATKSMNLQNQRKARKDNLCGFLGVHVYGKRFQAAIRINGKHTYIGTYDTAELAHAAYLAKKREHHSGNTL